MIVAALCFLSGVALLQFVPTPTGISASMFLFSLIGVMLWRRQWRIMIFMAGTFWAMLFATTRLHDRLPESLEGIDIKVTGRVISLPEVREKSVRFVLLLDETNLQLPSRLRLTWYQPQNDIKSGQRWTFMVKLKRPHGTFNPGGFDYERWLFMEGIGATGYVRNSPPPLLINKPSLSDIDGLRQRLVDSLSRQRLTPQSQALIRALTLGDSSQISQVLWDVFRKTGTTHLVVISGSHIGLIAGLVYFLTLKGWARVGILRWPPHQVAAGACLTSTFLYAFLAGFAIPTQRAVIMLSVAMLAVVRQRQTRPFNTLAVALIAVLLADPLAVLSPGFWLSFLAVALILVAVSGRLKQPGYFIAALKLHGFTSLGLAPLVVLFFQQVSLIAPIANLFAVPLISLIVLPLSLMGLVLLPISSTAAHLFLIPTDYTLQGLVWLLNKMSMVPLGTIHHPEPSLWALIFAAPGILLLLSPRGTSSRWLGMVMILPLAFIHEPRPVSGEIELTLLDVGQGLAVTVETANHWLVFDTGSKFSPENDMGRSVLLPFLFTKNVGQIDTLVISHGDNDHVGGASSIFRNIKVDHVITSAPDKLADRAPSLCKAGQSWKWDEVTFTMLSPQDLKAESHNDNSCVLKIQSENGSILLTGDIEAPAESRLVESYPERLQADVMVAPHHGSNTSSTETFLNAVKPGFILIPAGYRNQFGHPHASVLERYRDIGATWLTSAESGAIIVSVANRRISVQAYRQMNPKYWGAVPKKSIHQSSFRSVFFNDKREVVGK